MNKAIKISAKEQHGNKAVEILLDKYNYTLYVTALGESHWNGVNIDDEILDMIINVALDFKHKMAESRRRAAA